ncbi:hypothetical protein EDB85DRAFT_2275470 [Lactarius pseudohatsudake]|nr:hypothetical protein EDB85DRAFT_2275470 [Lactarius pseudohatsudake]
MALWWVACVRWCRLWSLWEVVSGDGRVVPLTATAAITAATAARGQVHTTTTTTAAWINASATQPTWRRHDDCHDDHRWCDDSTTMAQRRRDRATTAKTTMRVGRATTAQRLRNDGASRLRNDRTATAQQRHESAVRRRRDEHHDRDYDRDHGHEAAGDEAAAEGRAVGGDGNGNGAAGMAMAPWEWRWHRGNGDGAAGMVTVAMGMATWPPAVGDGDSRDSSFTY